MKGNAAEAKEKWIPLHCNRFMRSAGERDNDDERLGRVVEVKETRWETRKGNEQGGRRRERHLTGKRRNRSKCNARCNMDGKTKGVICWFTLE